MSDEKKYLTPAEIDQLLKATRISDHPKRNHLLFLLIFRHGLRVSELTNLKLNQIDLKSGQIFCKRLKKSLSTAHPLQADELRLLKAYIKDRDSHSPYLFISERGTPFTRGGIYYLVKVIAERGKLPFHVHPHMLRHSCGYALAEKNTHIRLIQDFLGHKQIQHTVRYTQVNASRFEGMWD